jgi:hypothetical protein
LTSLLTGHIPSVSHGLLSFMSDADTLACH